MWEIDLRFAPGLPPGWWSTPTTNTQAFWETACSTRPQGHGAAMCISSFQQLLCRASAVGQQRPKRERVAPGELSQQTRPNPRNSPPRSCMTHRAGHIKTRKLWSRRHAPRRWRQAPWRRSSRPSGGPSNTRILLLNCTRQALPGSSVRPRAPRRRGAASCLSPPTRRATPATDGTLVPLLNDPPIRIQNYQLERFHEKLTMVGSVNFS